MRAARTLALFIATVVFSAATAQEDRAAAPVVGREAQVRLSTPRFNWVVGAEHLLMRAQRRGLDYAIVDPDGDTDPEGPIRSMSEELDYDSGYRFRVGLELPRDDVIDFTYTNFDQEAFADVREAPGGRIWIPQIHPQDAANYSRVQSTYELDLRVYDLTYSRTYSNPIGMGRIYGGIRGADMRQRFDTVGFVGGAGTNAEESLQTSIDFQGAGVLTGYQMSRRLLGSVYMVGDVTGSLLLGNTESRYLLTDDTNLQTNVTQTLTDTVPIAELELGLLWKPRFAGQHLELAFGWQQMTWFDVAQVQQFIDDGGADRGLFANFSHNLNLSAVTFSVSFFR